MQLQRLSDGKRKVTSIAEITGMEGDIIQMQEIFNYVRTGTRDGRHRPRPFPGDRRAAALPRRSAGAWASRSPGSYFDPVASRCEATMSFDIDPIYLIYAAARRLGRVLFAEGVYLLFFSGASYRNNVNRRLHCCATTSPTARASWSSCARARADRGRRLSACRLVALNRLSCSPACTLGLGKLVAVLRASAAVIAFAGVTGDPRRRCSRRCSSALVLPATLLPFWCCAIMRGRRQKRFGAQFPDALDIIVRSLRAGHPVPVAITMVAREMPDPIGTEFGIVADEITYGADLETAMRNLYFRVGQDDLPLFVTAVAIQGSTGGNLGEILENLSA